MTVQFEHLLAAHMVRAHRAALGLMRDEQEAREAAQEALLKAYRARGRYDPTRPFYPWLYRILRNTCFDALARRRTRAVSGLDSDRVASLEPSAADALMAGEEVDRVRAAMARLTEAHREILGMRHFQDLSYAEMAELLEVPEGTVMSRLYRARRALVRALDEGDGATVPTGATR
jgi:RNA polymerase sigma-70 factor (ECF subfamily)